MRLCIPPVRNSRSVGNSDAVKYNRGCPDWIADALQPPWQQSTRERIPDLRTKRRVILYPNSHPAGSKETQIPDRGKRQPGLSPLNTRGAAIKAGRLLLHKRQGRFGLFWRAQVRDQVSHVLLGHSSFEAFGHEGKIGAAK